MAAINNTQLAYQMATRIRPRSEWFVGLKALLESDLPFIQAGAVDLDPATQIFVGQELTFTGAMFIGYVGLVETLLAAATTDVVAAFQSAVVRDLQTIMSQFPAAGNSSIADGIQSLFLTRVQPRARALRQMNSWFSGDAVALAPNIAALVNPQSGDTITEGRAGVPDLTFGALQTILAFEAACEGPSVNTAAVSELIEAACGQPLQVI